MCYKCHDINLNRGRSYVVSADWIKTIKKTKKITSSLINEKDNKCFQNAITVPLSHEQIKKDPQRITEIKSFINKYDWEGMSYPSGKDDWKNFEKNSLTIAFNILYAEKEKLYPVYLSKHNSNRKKQVIILTIPNGEGWYYLVVKNRQRY